MLWEANKSSLPNNFLYKLSFSDDSVGHVSKLCQQVTSILKFSVTKTTYKLTLVHGQVHPNGVNFHLLSLLCIKLLMEQTVLLTM